MFEAQSLLQQKFLQPSHTPVAGALPVRLGGADVPQPAPDVVPLPPSPHPVPAPPAQPPEIPQPVPDPITDPALPGQNQPVREPGLPDAPVRAVCH